MKTEQQIAKFVENELLDGRVPKVDPLACGMLDSLALEALVAWIEDKFKIQLTDEDLVVDNFGSLAALSAFVETRRSGAAGRPAQTGTQA
jgi:acyl carrier protein